jgi:predicted ATPase
LRPRATDPPTANLLSSGDHPAMMTTSGMSHAILRAENFRVLHQLEWSPAGVCLLAGPNGSGKSTLLSALRFLRAVFMFGHEVAFNSISGSYFRRLGTPAEEPVTFEFELGDIRWRLRFPMFTSGLRGQYGEELFRGDELILRAAMFDEGWYLGNERREIDPRRCCARVLLDSGQADWMKPLEDFMSNMRIHNAYDLEPVKYPQSDYRRHSLHSDGGNLWSVLSNWKQGSLKHGDKFQWVMEAARHAFPDIMGSLEFDQGMPFLFGPRASDPADGLPPFLAADGLLTGLLHLTAIADAHNGALVAFDEIENQLHPHAIRSLLAAMRQQADERGLTIIMTTHSPVVMNEFKGHEDQFYVIRQPSSGPVPSPLDELYDPDWLDHFVLGDLYERLEIAAPAIGEAAE